MAEVSHQPSFEEQKESLLQEFIAARSSILEAARSFPLNQLNEAFVGEWGILELLAHLRGWDFTNLEASQAILACKLPDFYSRHDRDWASYNAELVSRYKQDNPGSMIASVEASFTELIDYLQGLSAGDIFGDHGVRRGSYKVLISRLIAAETKDEQKHLEQIREFLG